MGTGNKSLLELSEKQIILIKESVNLGNQDKINHDIDMIVEWFEKQQHLPRIKLDRHMVEYILICRKGSVEQTKQKIDMLYTLRTLIPELAAQRDILHPDIQKQFKGIVFAVMPKLNHDLTRINMFQFTEDVDSFNLQDTLKYMFMIMEYRMQYDYCAGDRYVCDFQYTTLGHYAKLYPTTVKNFEVYLRKGYGSRIKGIHYMNMPSFVGKVVTLVKSALSDKLATRLLVHTTLEDLHKHVDKSVLPKDFGGDEDTLATYAELWKAELSKEENRLWQKEQEKLRSDESLRIGVRDSDDMLGIPGSFKSVNVD